MSATPYQREIAYFYLWCINHELLVGVNHESENSEGATESGTGETDANEK